MKTHTRWLGAFIAVSLLCFGWLGLTRQPEIAYSQGLQPIERERDLPDFDARHAAELAQADAQLAAAPAFTKLPVTLRAAQFEYNAQTQTPRRIWGMGQAITAPTRMAAPSALRQFLQQQAALFRLTKTDLVGLRVMRHTQTKHNGVSHVVLQQYHANLPVFQAEFAAHFDRQGALVASHNELTPNLAATINRSEPVIGRAPALALALQALLPESPTTHAAEAKNGQSSTSLAEPLLTNQLSRDPDLQLVYFPLSATQTRLAWQMTLWLRAQPAVYLVLVDAERGTLLYRRNLTHYEKAEAQQVVPRGLVFTGESPRPAAPLGNLNPPVVPREEVPFHATSFQGQATFATGNPHFNWWAGNPLTGLISNNTDTHLDRDLQPNRADEPRLEKADSNFSFGLDFNLAPTSEENQKAAQVNLFYWVNRYHDVLYSFGFDEQAGNFQTDNFNLGGRGNDAIQADAQDGSGLSNANFTTPPDGLPGRVQMYLWSGVPQLDGDFDQGVIVHELTHGLSNRLIGNATGLSDVHGQGMGEGWSDFFGLVLFRTAADEVDGSYAIGQYVQNNYARGIRRFPYSTNKNINPLTYQDLRTNSESHAVGEIWCSLLLDMRAFLIKQYGFALGQRQSLQLVVDGMKLAPRAPSFLDARNALLLADRLNNGGINQCLLWQAFSQRGLGARATALNSRDIFPQESLAMPPACNAGATLTIDRPAYLLGESLRVMLGDRNATAPARVTVKSSVTNDEETLTLSADPTQVGAFFGELPTAFGTARNQDGVLQAAQAAGDRLLVSYVDEDNGNGQRQTVQAQAAVTVEAAIFEDMVETGNRGWQAVRVSGASWGVTSTVGASGTQSWTDSPNGNYSANTDSSLVSPPFDLRGVTSAALGFAQRYALEDGFDYGFVEATLDDGATWQPLSAVSGTQSEFRQTRLNLDALRGNQNVRIRFRLLTDANNQRDGWWVDDIRLLVRQAQNGHVSAALVPALSALEPASGAPTGGNVVRLSGVNFTENRDTRVFFNGVPATNVNVLGGTALTCVVPAATRAGAVLVRVENRYGAALLANGYLYYTRPAEPAKPGLLALTPEHGVLTGGTWVALQGHDFTPDSQVQFGAQAARAMQFVSTNLMRALTPAALPAIATTVDVTVSHSLTEKATLPNAFRYRELTPPTLSVLPFEGGARAFTGQRLAIRWQSSDNRMVARHRVELHREIGPTTQKVADVINDLPGTAQSFNWQIPSDLAAFPFYTLRVFAIDDEGAETPAYSSSLAIERRWQAQVSLGQAVQRAVLVADEQALYLFGGRTSTTSGTTTANTYRLDPRSAATNWTSLAPLPVGLNAADGAVLQGKIYVPGGINQQVLFEQQHFVYDIGSNLWATAPAPPRDLFLYATVADASRGVYYQLGGLGFASGEAAKNFAVFDPQANQWSELPPMLTGRFAHETALIDGKLYVAGGSGDAGGLTSCEVFDFTTRQWSALASLPRPRRYAGNALAKTADGRALWLLAGGENPNANGMPLAELEAYDLAANRWIQLDASYQLPNARTAVASVVFNDQLYLAGGGTAASGTGTNTTAVERLQLANLLLATPNQPPVLVAPNDTIAFVGADLQLEITANDFGNEVGAATGLALTAEQLPAGAEFELLESGQNFARGRLRWRPTEAAVDRTYPIVLRATDGQFTETKVVTVTVAKATPLAVVSAATYSDAALASESISAAFGTQLATGIASAQGLPLPTTLAGVSVTVNGQAAPLFFVSPTQLNFLLPPTLAPGPAQVVVTTQGPLGNQPRYAVGNITVAASAPGLFTTDAMGRGDVVATATADGINYQRPPFDVSVGGQPNILVLFGTGVRRAATELPNDENGVAEALSITIDGQTARVLYAGPQPGLVGLDQINVAIPASLAGQGERRVPLEMQVNGRSANRVFVLLK